MGTRSQELASLLQLFRTSGTVEGSAVISRDGILVLSDLPASMSHETFSAMTAAMLGAAETAMESLGHGLTHRVVVETEGVRLLATGINPELMLVVVSSAKVDFGSLIAQVNPLLDSIRKIVHSSPVAGTY